jgi:hypothetical protein
LAILYRSVFSHIPAGCSQLARQLTDRFKKFAQCRSLDRVVDVLGDRSRIPEYGEVVNPRDDNANNVSVFVEERSSRITWLHWNAYLILRRIVVQAC